MNLIGRELDEIIDGRERLVWSLLLKEKKKTGILLGVKKFKLMKEKKKNCDTRLIRLYFITFR